MQCCAGNPGLIPGLGRSPGEGNGNPLQSSGLETPLDRGASRAAVHGVAKSRTQLKWLSMHTRKLSWGPQEREGRRVRDKWTLTVLDVSLRWRHASLLHSSPHTPSPNWSSPNAQKTRVCTRLHSAHTAHAPGIQSTETAAYLHTSYAHAHTLAPGPTNPGARPSPGCSPCDVIDRYVQCFLWKRFFIKYY